MHGLRGKTAVLAVSVAAGACATSLDLGYHDDLQPCDGGACVDAAALIGTRPRDGDGGATDGSGPDAREASNGLDATTADVATSDAATTDAADARCAVGQTRCVGTQVETCLGGAWSTPAACGPGLVCAREACLPPAPTISANTELCGDHVYAGTFSIQGGARVTCASGKISIEADDILIDPASSVHVSAVPTGRPDSSLQCGDPPRGLFAFFGGGGGGGHGTAGGRGESGGWPQVQDICTICPGAPGGPALGSPDDIGVEPGGSGGTGREKAGGRAGGDGGGTIRLLASRTIHVLGTIEADGEPGTGGQVDTGGGGAGGGAGGGILLAAPTVDIDANATISAKGGVGTMGYGVRCAINGAFTGRGGLGAAGRIKIASSTGASSPRAVGEVSAGYLPPTRFVSTTHPSSQLAYGDAFAELQLSWLKPYPAARGVYYVVDQSPSTRVTQANGTFTTATNVTVPGATFTAGHWYVHFATVHQDDTLSSLSSAWGVTITGSPPVLASTSHPNPTTWYPSKVVSFAWDTPADVPPGSVQSFAYRLDRESTSTMSTPSAPGWTTTTTKQVVLTVDASGAPVGDGAYHFHVVPIDTQGRITRGAAHATVLVGAEPSRRAFFGYVDNDRGAKVVGATVALEPLGLSAATNASGYFLIPNVFDGAYAVTVSAPGHKTARSTMTVNASASPVTLTLVVK